MESFSFISMISSKFMLNRQWTLAIINQSINEFTTSFLLSGGQINQLLLPLRKRFTKCRTLTPKIELLMVWPGLVELHYWEAGVVRCPVEAVRSASWFVRITLRFVWIKCTWILMRTGWFRPGIKPNLVWCPLDRSYSLIITIFINYVTVPSLLLDFIIKNYLLTRRLFDFMSISDQYD